MCTCGPGSSFRSRPAPLPVVAGLQQVLQPPTGRSQAREEKNSTRIKDLMICHTTLSAICNFILHWSLEYLRKQIDPLV